MLWRTLSDSSKGTELMNTRRFGSLEGEGMTDHSAILALKIRYMSVWPQENTKQETRKFSESRPKWKRKVRGLYHD